MPTHDRTPRRDPSHGKDAPETAEDIFSIDFTTDEPLYAQIEAYITRLIQDRVLAEGTRLPSPNVLAQIMSVNRMTVIRSIRSLVDRGLLTTQTGRGTFVAAHAGARRVLWVCGQDIFRGDISPYFTDVLRHGQEAGRKLGLRSEAIWLSPLEPDKGLPYCNETKLREYAGYIFMLHEAPLPLPQAVMRAGLPYVYINSSRPPAPRRVSVDRPQALRMSFKELRKRGHKQILYMSMTSSSFRVLAADIAAKAGVELRYLDVPSVHTSVTAYERFSAAIMQQEIAEHGVPRALIITDEIVARGATRALLVAGADASQLDFIAVGGDRESLGDYGLPTTYIAKDVRLEAEEAIHILHNQIIGRFDRPDHILLPFHLVSHSHALELNDVFSQASGEGDAASTRYGG